MYKLTFERVGLPKNLAGYNYIACTKAVYEDDIWTWDAIFGLSHGSGGSVTAVCGAGSITSPTGYLISQTFPKKKIPDPLEKDKNGKAIKAVQYGLTEDFVEKIIANGAFKEIRETLLKNSVEELVKLYSSGTMVMGGRMNIKRARYITSYGVHSGTIARYIIKNKVGTMTASHLHQNSGHRTKGDFSLQQVFVWSPPGVEIIPVNKRYCGVFASPEQEAKSIASLTKSIGEGIKWIMYRPRYYLRNPFMKDDAHVT